MSEFSTHHANHTDRLFSRLVEEWTVKLQAGEQIDLSSYAQQYPEYAEKLHDLLSTVEVLADLDVSAPNDPAVLEASSAEQIPGKLGDYRIRNQIGRGGMGVVYEADQISLSRRVALKVLPFAAVLDPKQLQRFKNEAIAAASLDHPNIVPVYSVGSERGVYYYAMRLIDGQTLAQVIEQLRSGQNKTGEGKNADSETNFSVPWPSNETPSADKDTKPTAATATHGAIGLSERFRMIARLGIQAAEALQHAHDVGLVHRDIKPSNLLVDGQGHLWVTDFGLVQMTRNSNLTVTGELLGTLRYMSPEQAAGRRSIADHRTDVYSLGATLYELLTLRSAFDELDRQKLMRQIEQQEPPAPRKISDAIPKDLETIVLKSMAKGVESRYQSSREMADDLCRFLRREPIHARRSSPMEYAWRWCKRNPVVAVLAAFVACLLVFLLIAGPLLLLKQESLANAADKADKAQHHAEQKLVELAHNYMFLQRNLANRSLDDVLFEVDMYERWVEEYPTNQAFRHSLAFGYSMLAASMSMADRVGRSEEYFCQAIDEWEKLAREFTPTAENLLGFSFCHTLYGKMLAKNYRLQEAEDQFRNAIVIHQRAVASTRLKFGLTQAPLAFTKWELGNVLLLRGNFSDAVTELVSAIEILEEIADFDQPILRALLGYCWRDLSDAQLAMCQFENSKESLLKSLKVAQGLSNEDSLATAYYRLGNLFHWTNRPQEAREAFEKAFELAERRVASHPKHTMLLVVMLSTCPDQSLRETERAVGLAKRSVASGPENGHHWHLLGVAQFQDGQWKDAVKSLTMSKELRAGGDSFDRLFLSMAYWQLDKKEAARQSYSEALDYIENRNCRVNRSFTPLDLLGFRAQAEQLMND